MGETAADSLPTEADYVVVGGGVIGASVAFQLARHGAQRVLLLDARHPVRGVSAQSFGQARTHYSNEVMIRLAHRGIRMARDWDREIGFGTSGYVPLGYLLLATEETETACQRNVELGRTLGVPTRYLEPEEVAHIEPLLVTDDLAGGAYEPEGGLMDARAMVLSWLVGAEALGARVITGLGVEAIEVENARVSGVRTPAGRVEAGNVVNAAGAWGRDLSREAGAEAPIDFLRLDMAWMCQPPGQPNIQVPFTDTGANLVCRPGAGPYFLGVAYPDRQLRVADPDIATTDDDLAEHLSRLKPALANRVPALAGAEAVGTQAGAYDVTPDYHPVLGPEPEVAGLFSAIGWSGHGLKVAPAVGEAVAQELTAGGAAIDLHPLRPERFAERDLNALAYGSIARA